MTVQISLRMPEKMLEDAKSYSEARGYTSVQELLRESLREKMYDPIIITKSGIEKIEIGLREAEKGETRPFRLDELRKSSGKK